MKLSFLNYEIWEVSQFSFLSATVRRLIFISQSYGTVKQWYINANDAAHMRIEFKSNQDDLDDESVRGLREVFFS